MKRLISAFVMLNAVVFFIVFPNPRKKAKKENYDCAIVCGYFANSDGTPSEFMKSRVDKAVELWKKEKVKYLLLSGGAVRNEHTEAYVMKKYAMKLGVPEDVILIESEAVSTYHNMLYAKARNAVIAAQRYFGLPQTGSVDAATWEEIYDQFAGIENESLRNGEAFPRLPAAVPTFAQTNTGRSRYSRTSTLTQFPGFDLQAGQRDPVRQEVVR